MFVFFVKVIFWVICEVFVVFKIFGRFNFLEILFLCIILLNNKDLFFVCVISVIFNVVVFFMVKYIVFVVWILILLFVNVKVFVFFKVFWLVKILFCSFFVMGVYCKIFMIVFFWIKL